MSGIDIRRFLNNFGQNNAHQRMLAAQAKFNAPAQPSAEVQKSAELLANNTQQLTSGSTASQIQQNLQLNTLQSMDRAIYAKRFITGA